MGPFLRSESHLTDRRRRRWRGWLKRRRPGKLERIIHNPVDLEVELDGKSEETFMTDFGCGPSSIFEVSLGNPI